MEDNNITEIIREYYELHNIGSAIEARD